MDIYPEVQHQLLELHRRSRLSLPRLPGSDHFPREARSQLDLIQNQLYPSRQCFKGEDRRVSSPKLFRTVAACDSSRPPGPREKSQYKIYYRFQNEIQYSFNTVSRLISIQFQDRFQYEIQNRFRYPLHPAECTRAVYEEGPYLPYFVDRQVHLCVPLCLMNSRPCLRASSPKNSKSTE
jgi:hypothetical protein